MINYSVTDAGHLDARVNSTAVEGLLLYMAATKWLSASSNVFIPSRPDTESLPILNDLDDGFVLRAENGFHPMYRRVYGPVLTFRGMSSVSFTRVDGGIIICGSSGKDTVYKLVTVEELLLWEREHARTSTSTARVQNVMHSTRKTTRRNSKKRTSKKSTSKKRTSKKRGTSKNITRQTKLTAEERKAQSAKDIAAHALKKEKDTDALNAAAAHRAAQEEAHRHSQISKSKAVKASYANAVRASPPPASQRTELINEIPKANLDHKGTVKLNSKIRGVQDLEKQLQGLLGTPNSKIRGVQDLEQKPATTVLTVLEAVRLNETEEFVRALSISKAKFDRVVRLRGADYTMKTTSNTDYTTIALRMASGQTTMLFAGKPWL